MARPAVIAGHPIHPMLIVFPIGLWVFSLVADLIRISTGAPVWSDVAFYTMAGGLIGAVVAAVPGFFDYLTITERRAARTATLHMALNLALVVLYAFNLFLRAQTETDGWLPVLLSLTGIAILGMAGWLGGDLVYVHGMGVRPTADKRTEFRRV